MFHCINTRYYKKYVPTYFKMQIKIVFNMGIVYALNHAY